ncbi:MAG TPA: DegV family protein [Anaerolineae bacterium]
MKIITDSAADLSPAELAALDIAQAPLYIHFPDGEVDPATIDPDEFYDRLAAMHPRIPTTAQPAGGLFSRLYGDALAGGEEVLSVHVSSGLSGTLNAARVGAEQCEGGDRVCLWDTLTLAGGERFQVLAAAGAARLGWPLAQIQERLAQIRNANDVVFTLETIEYLARGGRIGRVQALAGLLLNIKPVIHVDHRDGKYNGVAKARTMPKALDAIVDYLKGIHDGVPLWVIVQHGRVPAQAAALADLIRVRLNVARLDTIRITPVLGVHTGPGIVGACVVPMNLLAGLV